MWRVDRPEDTAKDTFRLCISRVRVADLKKRLQEAEGQVVAAGKTYVEAAESATLHDLDVEDFELTRVGTSEMVTVYSGRMAGKRSPGRVVYDALILGAKDGCCPLCGQRTVSTLDHHLPKSLYPALAVNPLNLVPACSDCNKLKLDVVPSSAEDQTLHPYFDDVEGQAWLRARVVKTSPVALQFFVDTASDMDEILARRVRAHFKKLRLSFLYGSQAAQELSNIRFRLLDIYASGGALGGQQVQQHLAAEAKSRCKANVNSWQTAMYAALASSSWFCNGGFDA